MQNLQSKTCWATVLAFAVLLLPMRMNAKEPLRLNVHPYLPPTELVKRFTPLCTYLGQKLKRPVTVEVARNYRDNIEQIGADKADLAYLGPASYVKMVDLYGQKPILGRLEVNGRPVFQGVIFVGGSSPMRSLADLASKRFAFGDPYSTMSHLVPRFMLWQAGVTVDNLAGFRFLNGHHNVVLGVLMGDFDAGAVKEEVFYEYRDRGLKELAKTPLISEHLFIACSALSPETVLDLRETLLNLKNHAPGRAAMSAIKPEMTAIVPAGDADYDNLRTILHALETLGVGP